MRNVQKSAQRLTHQYKPDLVCIIFCEIKDKLPPLSGGVGGIKNLTDDTGQSGQTAYYFLPENINTV